MGAHFLRKAFAAQKGNSYPTSDYTPKSIVDMSHVMANFSDVRPNPKTAVCINFLQESEECPNIVMAKNGQSLFRCFDRLGQLVVLSVRAFILETIS
eukprot:2215958-Amphidinium_carterae.1